MAKLAQTGSPAQRAHRKKINDLIWIISKGTSNERLNGKRDKYMKSVFKLDMCTCRWMRRERRLYHFSQRVVVSGEEETKNFNNSFVVPRSELFHPKNSTDEKKSRRIIKVYHCLTQIFARSPPLTQNFLARNVCTSTKMCLSVDKISC